MPFPVVVEDLKNRLGVQDFHSRKTPLLNSAIASAMAVCHAYAGPTVLNPTGQDVALVREAGLSVATAIFTDRADILSHAQTATHIPTYQLLLQTIREQWIADITAGDVAAPEESLDEVLARVMHAGPSLTYVHDPQAGTLTLTALIDTTVNNKAGWANERTVNAGQVAAASVTFNGHALIIPPIPNTLTANPVDSAHFFLWIAGEVQLTEFEIGGVDLQTSMGARQVLAVADVTGSLYVSVHKWDSTIFSGREMRLRS